MLRQEVNIEQERGVDPQSLARNGPRVRGRKERNLSGSQKGGDTHAANRPENSGPTCGT
jgi:hypothetical protein